MEPAIYFGTIRHRRFEPARHEFTYPLFMAFLDVDRIPELMKVSPFTSYNRFNWASFHERDHFGDPALPLRQRLVADAAEQGIRLPEGPIFLLTHLRYLGYSFNPISLFYCYDREGRLDTILAEVNSTFGETHNYWLSAANRIASTGLAHVPLPKGDARLAVHADGARLPVCIAAAGRAARCPHEYDGRRAQRIRRHASSAAGTLERGLAPPRPAAVSLGDGQGHRRDPLGGPETLLQEGPGVHASGPT